MTDSSRRIKVILAMAIMYVVWGTTYLAIKVGLDAGLPPTLFAGVRQIPAAALLFAIAAWRGARLRISPQDLRISVIVGILLIVGGQYFTFLAEQSVPSGISALVVALLPLWIALAESAFPDMQRPGRLGWVGLAIGFSGLGILLAPRLIGVSAGAGELAGIALQIVGTWLWASGSIYSKRNPASADNMVMTAYEMLAAGVVLLALGTLLGEWPRFVITPKAFWALAYLAVVRQCDRVHRLHLRAAEPAGEQGDDVRVREPRDRGIRGCARRSYRSRATGTDHRLDAPRDGRDRRRGGPRDQRSDPPAEERRRPAAHRSHSARPRSTRSRARSSRAPPSIRTLQSSLHAISTSAFTPASHTSRDSRWCGRTIRRDGEAAMMIITYTTLSVLALRGPLACRKGTRPTRRRGHDALAALVARRRSRARPFSALRTRHDLRRGVRPDDGDSSRH